MKTILNTLCAAVLLAMNSSAWAHGDPIFVDVANDVLTVSGGTLDQAGYADQVFSDPSIDSALSPAGSLLVTEFPGFDINNMDPNSGLFLEVLPRPVRGAVPATDRLLWHWNQVAGTVQLAPGTISLNLVSQRGFGSRTVPQAASPVPAALQIAQPLSSDLGNHKHLLLYTLPSSAAAGAFGFFARLTSPVHEASDPFLVVLNNGLDAIEMQTAATAINAAAVAGLPGDFNNDNIVDAADYTVWRNNFGNSSEAVIQHNGNGTGGVDETDYDLWKQHYGTVSQGNGGVARSVPEPHGFLLAMMACSGLFMLTAGRIMRIVPRASHGSITVPNQGTGTRRPGNETAHNPNRVPMSRRVYDRRVARRDRDYRRTHCLDAASRSTGARVGEEVAVWQ